MNRKARAGRLEEGIEVISGAWAKDDFSFEGQHYKVKKHPFNAAAGAVAPSAALDRRPAPKAIQRAGRMGCHFMGVADPGAQKIYDSALLQAGHKPQDFSAAQLHFTFVGTRTKIQPERSSVPNAAPDFPAAVRSVVRIIYLPQSFAGNVASRLVCPSARQPLCHRVSRRPRLPASAAA